VKGIEDELVKTSSWFDASKRSAYGRFTMQQDMAMDEKIRHATSTVRPPGSDDFVKGLEKLLSRRLLAGKVGCPKRNRSVSLIITRNDILRYRSSNNKVSPQWSWRSGFKDLTQEQHVYCKRNESKSGNRFHDNSHPVFGWSVLTFNPLPVFSSQMMKTGVGSHGSRLKLMYNPSCNNNPDYKTDNSSNKIIHDPSVLM